MKPYTRLDQIVDIIKAPYFKVEYFFAKKWLDSNFGKREYWGNYIGTLKQLNNELPCSFSCSYQSNYGFVIEENCPIHDL